MPSVMMTVCGWYPAVVSVFLRGLSKVGRVLTVGIVVTFCGGCGTSALPRDEPGDSAQSNLDSALAGGRVYYSANHDSYVGIDGSSQLPTGVSSIAELDTGLAYVSGHQNSVRANIVSIYSPDPSALVVTIPGARPRVCWGILSLKHDRTRPYLPAFPSTAKAGTYYLRVASANCAAAKTVPAAVSTTGFPTT